jgi:hypothetical protein
MKIDLEKIATLERINYLTMEPAAKLTTGAEIILRADMILTSSETYPSPDANHACLLQSDPQKVDALIDEVIVYFTAREMPPVVLVSQACLPADLSQRLLARGFQRQEPDETWMVLENLQDRKVPKIESKVEVKKISPAEAPLFAEVMVASYDMPAEYVTVLADLIAPTIGAPGVTHFLAFLGQKPIATLTLMRYQNYVTIGSAGVLPEHRGGRTIFNMSVEVLAEAKRQGVETVLLQTSLGPIFERFLRICGFSLAFKRNTYILT